MNEEEKSIPVKALLIPLGLLLLYMLTRAPFFLQPLMGEEGIFAHMLAASPAGPDYGLVARVNGKAVCEPLRHPALMYEAYTRLGQFMRMVGTVTAPTDIWARMLHACFQGALWLILALRFSKLEGKNLWLAGVLALIGLSSALGMSASIYLQTDTSTGLLLAGLLALSLAEAPASRWALAAAFALGAVGKQEWSIAAGAAMLGAYGAAFALKKSGETWKRPALLFAALLLGNLASWAFDPLNYLGGFGVLGGISPGHQALAEGQSQAWSALWPVRRPFVLGLLAMLLPATWMAWRAEPGRVAGEWAACALAWALFLPFIASTWNNSPRYFAPAWAAALACLASQIAARSFSKRQFLLLSLAGLVLVAVQIRFLAGVGRAAVSLTEFPFYPVPAIYQHETDVAEAAKPGCAPLLTSGYAWSRGIDFVGSAMAPADAEALVKKHGGRLCPPPRKR